MRPRTGDALLRRLQCSRAGLWPNWKYLVLFDEGGKTYTMGTSHGYASCDEEQGILPRVINTLFQEMHRRQEKAQFTVRASFL